MNKTEMDETFKRFENKYGIPPVYPISDGNHVGAFIITFKNRESFMIAFDSPDEDVNNAAEMLDPDHPEEAAKDIKALQAFCSAPLTNTPAPDRLQ